MKPFQSASAPSARAIAPIVYDAAGQARSWRVVSESAL
jgi:hypothetical protein